MHILLFTIGWLALTAALVSLAWHLLCAGRWLYRWLHPWNEEVDARAREYLVKPHPLWTGGPLPRRGELKGKMIETQELSAPTTVAQKLMSVATDIVLGTLPPVGIPLPSPTVDGLQLAVEDLVSARRSSFRVVDSPASTEET